ncbi:ApeA N-terminal domain 1-containing protein [Arthrobacter terrae]|nr:HEPN domain-containing protein [Arthrobacter terrae]
MSKDARLDLPAEWTGNWWLPENPEHPVPGVLRYEPEEGLRLLLIGGFEDRTFHPIDGGMDEADETFTWPLLLGSADNKEITLLDCLSVSSESYGLGVGGLHKQTVSALTALVGVHLKNVDQEAFTKCEVSVENLNLWSDSSVFTKTLGIKDEKLNGEGSIHVKPTNEPSVAVSGTMISLAHVHTLPHFDHMRGQTRGRMRDTVHVRFEPTKACSLAGAREYARAIQDLVSLATHTACAILWIQLRMPPKDRDYYPEGYPIRDREVKVYFQGTVRGDAEAKALNRNDVLFTCHDLPFEEIMPRWWDIRQRFQPASNMILGLRYAPARYVEGNLLTATGAAEVLHRALRIDESPIPKEDFGPLREVLLDQTPDKYRSWVKGKLRNEPTLRERLIALAALPDEETMSTLVPDIDQWAKVTTQARNDLAHNGQTPKQSIDQLLASVKVTSAVVIFNLLQVLGVPGERQREVIHRNSELHQTAMQARIHLTVSEK